MTKYLDDVGVKHLVEGLDKKYSNNSNSSKLELKSRIERIGDYRYLMVEFPYSDELITRINSGKVALCLFKQSKKKKNIRTSRNAYIGWVNPLKDLGASSEDFIRSFGVDVVDQTGGTHIIKPSINLNTTSDVLSMTYDNNKIKLQYNLSDLAKRMTFSPNGNEPKVFCCEYAGQSFLDTAVAFDNPKVIGKRMTNKRVALRYKFALYFNDENRYSGFTDTITILYTKHNINYLRIGMQIN